jgi:hypothetical protein
MSSGRQNQKSDVEPKNKSDATILREGGWGDMNSFMLSYNLRIHNDDDVQEARQILEGYRQQDQQQYEARKQEKSKGK